MRDFEGFEEMIPKGENGDPPALVDVGTAPSIFLSGAQVAVEGPICHIIGWDHLTGLGDVRPEQRVAVRVTMTVEAARVLGAQLRRKLPGKSH